jgi:hypothetical protein
MPISKPNSLNSLVWVNVFFTWSYEFLCIDVKKSPQNRMWVTNAGTPPQHHRATNNNKMAKTKQKTTIAMITTMGQRQTDIMCVLTSCAISQ